MQHDFQAAALSSARSLQAIVVEAFAVVDVVARLIWLVVDMLLLRPSLLLMLMPV